MHWLAYLAYYPFVALRTSSMLLIGTGHHLQGDCEARRQSRMQTLRLWILPPTYHSSAQEGQVLIAINILQGCPADRKGSTVALRRSERHRRRWIRTRRGTTSLRSRRAAAEVRGPRRHL